MSDLVFNLALVEQITGPARMGQEALRKLQAQAKAAGDSLDYSKQAKASINALAAIKLDPSGYITAYTAAKKLAEEQERLLKQHGLLKSEGGFGAGLKSSLGFGGQFGAVALGEMAGEGIIKGAEFLVESAVKVGEILYDGIKEAFEAAGAKEHQRNAYRYIFGSQDSGNRQLDWADQLSGKLPYTDDQTASMLGRLGMAGIRGQSAANSLALAADTGAMSPTGQGTDEALESLTRLKLHGEFSPRLAQGLMVNLPDFYAAIGKKLGTDATSAQKKLGQPGAVGFNTIVNTLMALRQKQTGEPTGQAGIDQSQELLERWKKLQNLPEQYLQTISQAPGWDALSAKLGSVIEQLSPDSPNGKRIVDSLMGAFNRLADMAQRALTPENVDKFVRGLEKVVELVGKLVADVGPIINDVSRLVDAYDYSKKNNEGLPVGHGETWDKVKQVEGVSWLQDNFTLMGGDRAQLVQKAFDDGKITQPERDAWFGAPDDRVPAKASGATSVTIPQVTVNVQVPEGADVTEETMRQLAAKLPQHFNNFVERASDEDGE